MMHGPVTGIDIPVTGFRPWIGIDLGRVFKTPGPSWRITDEERAQAEALRVRMATRYPQFTVYASPTPTFDVMTAGVEDRRDYRDIRAAVAAEIAALKGEA